MVAASDETRFQVLPEEEDWERFKNLVEHLDKRILVLDKTFWHNAKTRCKGVVRNMPIMAFCDDSDRTAAITQIYVYKYDFENLETNLVHKWVFNTDYAHVNITNNTDNKTLLDQHFNGREDGKWEYKYEIYFQRICCPVTQHHMYTKPLDELKMIFTGQLQGQNSGSAFRTVRSVANNYDDRMLADEYGSFIKRTAPVIQLLTKKSISNIQLRIRDGSIRSILCDINRPMNDNEILVKLISEDRYTVIKKESLEELEKNGQLSAYYQPITYKQCQDILDTIPKAEMDVACIGLGSAGTGILDQVVRGNWFDKYLLVDFDIVEEKNLRNQWYVRSDVYYSKTTGSANKIKSIKRDAELVMIDKKFQEAGLDNYVSKYIISGFDSIECRLELLEYIEKGVTQAQYIIDTRYDDLDASVFFIDTSNAEQMAYYRKGLESDKEAFDEREKKEYCLSDWLDAIRNWGVFSSGCYAMRNKITGSRNDCPINIDGPQCGRADCLAFWTKIYEEHKERCDEIMREKGYNREESSCVKQNLIDIYKFASAFVFSAIREIEEGSEKPFTHVEVTTNKLPSSMVVRK